LVSRPPQAYLEPAELGLWACLDRDPRTCRLVRRFGLDQRFIVTEQVRILVLFGINILLHMLWSPLFFNLRRPDWALIEVPFLWLSIVALMLGLAPISSASVWLLTPYLLWVTFAAFLNWTIVRMNR
jgi:tryptophan-rich sensory protein